MSAGPANPWYRSAVAWSPASPSSSDPSSNRTATQRSTDSASDGAWLNTS